jgi:diguanylate cyclase (GGDEF)-like protein
MTPVATRLVSRFSFRKVGRLMLMLAAASIAALLLASLIANGDRGLDGARATLNELDRLDAQLSENLVLARHDLLPHYDAFGETNDAIGAHLDTLAGQVAAHAALTQRLDALRAAHADRLARIEDFKSLNAQLKNSLHYLPQASARLAGELRERGATRLARNVEQTALDLLAWNLTASAELADAIRPGIASIEIEALRSPMAEETTMLARHLRLVFERKPVLDTMLAALLDHPFRARLGAMKSAWQDAYRADQSRKRWSGAGLALLALVMFGVAIRSALRLRSNTAQLRHAATHDALTGLANRTQLHEDVRRAIAPDRGCTPFALMLLDLDGFKEVNDTLGHHIGDALLRGIGPRIAGVLPAGSSIARLGGDEFALLVCDVADRDAALALGERLREALRQPYALEGMQLVVSASIGIALFPDHGTDSGELLRRADVAMYAAKRGAGCVAYDVALDAHSPRRLALMSDLGQAVRGHGLTLHYQPKVALPGGEVTGVEALARWNHPELGTIPPDQFIPLLELSDLVHPFTRRVLELACAQAAVWVHAGRPLRVAVNLSARNLLDDTLPAFIASLLAKHALDPWVLELEITESALMSDPDHATALLEEISRLGVGLAIDDYGTGYSSLVYLRRLPVDMLKLDRAFIGDLPRDAENQVIVRSTILMAHELGLRVLAEGVEDGATRALLTRLQCDEIQGYLIARPMPARDLAAWQSQPSAVFPAVGKREGA